MSLLARSAFVIGMIAAFPVVLTLSLVSGQSEDSAQAANPPGENGMIVFTRSSGDVYDIWVMDPDGANQVNLTADQDQHAYYPAWSPDGTKIAYEVDVYNDGSDADIWVMNADGSGKMGIAEAATYEGGPRWSPDGTKITFHDGDDVWVMDANGSNKVRLTDDPAFDCCAEWSPDGSRIVFDSVRSGARVQWVMTPDGNNQAMVPGSIDGDQGYRFSPDGQQYVFYGMDDSSNVNIYTMNVDGTGRQQLTNNDVNEHSATWSADGSRIIFTREVASVGQIMSMKPDGSDVVNLSNSAGYDADADMQRLNGSNPTPTPTVPCLSAESQRAVGVSITCGPEQALTWGDSDCDGEISSRDNQALLRKVLSQNALSQTEPCPDLGDVVADEIWGDWDCDGAISTRDNQALLRYVLSQVPLSHTEPCPDIGETVPINA